MAQKCAGTERPLSAVILLPAEGGYPTRSGVGTPVVFTGDSRRTSAQTLFASYVWNDRCLLKTAHGRGFIVEDIKHGKQLGDLQKVVNFLRQVQQLQFPAAVPHRRESADQFSDPGTVNVIDVPEIQDDFRPAFLQQVAHRLPQK